MAQCYSPKSSFVHDVAIVHVEARDVPFDPVSEVLACSIAGFVKIRAVGIGEEDVRCQVIIIV